MNSGIILEREPRLPGLWTVFLPSSSGGLGGYWLGRCSVADLFGRLLGLESISLILVLGIELVGTGGNSNEFVR